MDLCRESVLQEIEQRSLSGAEVSWRKLVVMAANWLPIWPMVLLVETVKPGKANLLQMMMQTLDLGDVKSVKKAACAFDAFASSHSQDLEDSKPCS